MTMAMLPLMLTLTTPVMAPTIFAADAYHQSASRPRSRGIARRPSADGGDEAAAALAPGSTEIRYGTDEGQRILLWDAPARTTDGGRPPLAVFVHGGGWAHGTPEMVADKPAWFAAHGWAFASIGYRLLPDAPVEEQAADVGRALVRLRSEAARHGYDPDRILLLGHSAGAHLVALVSTDPRYAGSAFAAIRGVIPIDGAAYNVPQQMRDAGGFMLRRTYQPAFGDDAARQRALSPTLQAGRPDAPDWLILYDDQRADAVSQSTELATALRRAGVAVTSQGLHFDERFVLARHRRMNVDFGTAGYAANPAIEALMARVAGASSTVR